MISRDWADVWQRSCEGWHWPLLPRPRPGPSGSASEFPFGNYCITIDQKTLDQGPVYLENLFDHLIVHY
ncbi:MAG: VWA domain-containing protein, partial [Methanothrix sp.]|nr:VWA domain-containing protein [Methanothrix sp.]